MYNIFTLKKEEEQMKEKTVDPKKDLNTFNILLELNDPKYAGGLIYPWTNEAVKNYYDYIDLTNKKSLCITSSADHILHAILCGSTYVDAIDKNIFAKYYAALKIALIKTYDFEIFFSKFSNVFIRNDIDLDELTPHIEDYIKDFWKEMFKNPKYLNIYTSDGYLTPIINNCAFFDKELYKKMQDNLKKSEIKFYDLNIASRKTCETLNNSYSAIFASNTYEHLKPTKHKTYFKNCYNLLDNNGILYNYHCIYNPHEIKNKYLNCGKIITTYVDDSKKESCGVSIYKKLD